MGELRPEASAERRAGSRDGVSRAMPDRYLREALLRSDRWNACSTDAQNLYLRLLMVVDDYGTYDGREQVIAQQAYFTGRQEPLPLEELHRAGLIVRYTNAGKLFIALTRWGETLRGRRRHPAPPICNDLPDIKYRGKYGTRLDFRNPVNSDPVSILVDMNGRPTLPQPPEWRRIASDWMPVAAAQKFVEKAGEQLLQSLPAVTASNSVQLLPAVTSPIQARSNSAQQAVSSQESSVNSQESASQESASTRAQSNSAQLLQNPAPSGGNGEAIRLIEGRWEGLSEAQRLRWQDMLGEAVSVPDALAKAAAHVEAHPETRTRCEQGPDSYHAFLVRWLLREARAQAAYKGAH